MKTGITTFLFVLLLLTDTLNAQNSLYRDVKAKQVGDIITVVLRERTNGSASSDNESATSAVGSAEGSISGNFIPFEPTFGSGANVDYGADQKNQANSRQLLEGYISVEIVDITSAGDLIVQGNRLTEINGEIHEMILSGTVRQNDVDSRNQVLSYRIANANIKYMKKGGFRNKNRHKSTLRKIVFTGVSLGLGAAIIMRELQ